MVAAASEAVEPLNRFSEALSEATQAGDEFPEHLTDGVKELETAKTTFEDDLDRFEDLVEEISNDWRLASRDSDSLKEFAERAEPLTDSCQDLIRQADHLYRLLSSLAEAMNKRNGRRSLFKPIDEARKELVEHLRAPRYFRRQAQWLQERFPCADLRDVEGLVKVVDLKELEDNDWSLTPGRYVGIAPEEEDEDFDFEETIREIHAELEGLNAEATALAARISRNFQEFNP